MEITADMVGAVKVQFKKFIFEDDFVERGMTAWLTDVEWEQGSECYKLYFDFTEFEDINDKYFKQSYHPNRHTASISTDRSTFTAKEAGCYDPKYSVYFSCGNMTTRDDAAFAETIKEYLRVVDDTASR